MDSRGRYILDFDTSVISDYWDVILNISYQRNIGQAFIHGRMINDDFCNQRVWQIGLKEHIDALRDEKTTIYITPQKEGVADSSHLLQLKRSPPRKE